MFGFRTFLIYDFRYMTFRQPHRLRNVLLPSPSRKRSGACTSGHGKYQARRLRVRRCDQHGRKPLIPRGFFHPRPGPLRHRRIDATEGRLDFLQDTPPPSPDRPISNSQFLTYDLIMRAVITGEVTPPEQVNEFPFFVGQLLECPFHQLTIPVQPAQ